MVGCVLAMPWALWLFGAILNAPITWVESYWAWCFNKQNDWSAQRDKRMYKAKMKKHHD
jgi:hypothetical protein